MGDRMTMQSKFAAGDVLADPVAPPQAPMRMPKQVLTGERGTLRRRVFGLLAALMPGRHRPG
jgi:hypothetical protein